MKKQKQIHSPKSAKDSDIQKEEEYGSPNYISSPSDLKSLEKKQKGKIKISFDDVPTKLGSQEKTDDLTPSSISPDLKIQKRGKKAFGGLSRLFTKKNPNFHQSPNASKTEEQDEVSILEDEIKQKMELVKKKQEEKRLKIETEQKKIEEERKKIEEEKNKKVIVKSSGKEKQGMSSMGITFDNLQEIYLKPLGFDKEIICEKCGSIMRRKKIGWVKVKGNVYSQKFICKNCKNIKDLEIVI